MKRIVFLASIFFLSVSAIAQTPKNVIYVVGDGMGTAQAYYSVVAQGEKSNFLRFPFSGFSRTYSWNKYTTDSGAGGSALMTGHKVENYHIAVGPKGEWYPSIFAQGHQLGKKTGFVVTVSAIDATPATTYGHAADRKSKDTLSLQMAQSFHDVMIGCDQAPFLTENRKDGLSPIDTLKARGYDVAFKLKDMKHSKSDHLCALLSPTDEPGDASVRGPILKEGVVKALDILSRNPQGFMLMVEGSQIDWACHNNDTPFLKKELAEFDEVLGIILDWAEKDGNTLVVVTADHETGGLTLPKGNIEKKESETSYSTGSHTGVMVPIFSYGPGAERFSGIHQNMEVPQIIMSLIK